MARLSRLTLPGYVHHVLQRGNNREEIFTNAADRQYFIVLLEESSRKFGVAIHAYVLMSNHFHLLATPASDSALPQMMQAVGRNYVRYFNNLHGRTGTLWDGRYRCAIIDAAGQLLSCMAYVDLNPVRAGIAVEAAAYPWSSHGHYVGQRTDRLVSPHPVWWSLGNTPFAREAAYAGLVAQGLGPAQQAVFTASVLGGWALGDAAFMSGLQKRVLRRVQKARPGRPKSSAL